MVSINGLENLTSLKELYLSHNGILKIEGLQNLNELVILDLGANRIPKLENLSHLKNLEDLWMNENKVDSFDQLDELKSLGNLDTLILEHNPVYKVILLHLQCSVLCTRLCCITMCKIKRKMRQLFCNQHIARITTLYLF
jgi:protein phosphatase 1 regulatory subunit 7